MQAKVSISRNTGPSILMLNTSPGSPYLGAGNVDNPRYRYKEEVLEFGVGSAGRGV